MLRRRLALIALLTWLPGMAAATTTIDPVSGAFPFEILTGGNTNIDLQLGTDEPVVAVNIQFIVSGFMQITGCTNLFGVAGFNCTPLGGGSWVFSAGDFTNGLADNQGLVRLSVTATGPIGALTLGAPGDAAGVSTNYTFCTNGGPPCLLPLDQDSDPFDNQGAIIAVVTPEPGTLGLLGAGLLALGWAGSRARRG